MIQIQIFNTILNSIIQVIFFSIIPLLWWLVTARKKESFFKWIGLKKIVINGSMLKFITLIVIISVGYIFLISIIMSELVSKTDIATNQFYKQGWVALPSILFYAVIQTGLSEEIFFRGFLGKRLINKYNFLVGNTVQAIMFGLLHGMPFGFATNNILVTILLTILPGAFGWFQGWINEKYSSGSIIPSWIIHSLMNILSALSFALNL